MAKEDEEFRAYLEANGYDASQICGRSEATTVVDDVTSDKEEGLRLKSPFLPPPRIYPYVGYQFWHFCLMDVFPFALFHAISWFLVLAFYDTPMLLSWLRLTLRLIIPVIL